VCKNVGGELWKHIVHTPTTSSNRRKRRSEREGCPGERQADARDGETWEQTGKGDSLQCFDTIGWVTGRTSFSFLL